LENFVNCEVSVLFLKKHFTIIGLACVLSVPAVDAGAEGFAINEWSAEGVAMGGARMFAENDAANIAYNPASITKVRGEAFKQSAVYISPHGKYTAYDATGKSIDEGKNVVHAGWAPGNYYVKQLNDKDWIGVGLFSRFGMISEFERDSKVASNAFFSRLNGASLTPTYARKFDNKWSAAVGAEVNYVGLELQKNSQIPFMGGAATQTKGESWALGWNAAANYAFDSKNEIGLVYRSKVTHSMEADFKAYMVNGMSIKRDAYGKVTLPDSWAIGYNHKFDDRTRVELNGTYTKWSTYDALNIDIEVNGQPYILVHGGAIAAYHNYMYRYDNQEEYAVWNRIYYYEPDIEGKIIIFGHTPTSEYQHNNPLEIWRSPSGGKIGIDCGSGFPHPLSQGRHPAYGRLACLRLDDMKVFYSEEDIPEEVKEIVW